MKKTQSFCKDCVHFNPRDSNNGICARPIKIEFSVIIGATVTTPAHTWCDHERSKVTRFHRFLGNEMCGIEAIHFQAKTN